MKKAKFYNVIFDTNRESFDLVDQDLIEHHENNVLNQNNFSQFYFSKEFFSQVAESQGYDLSYHSIDLRDVISHDPSDENVYYFIHDSLWFTLTNENKIKIFADRNVVLHQMHEPVMYGFTYMHIGCKIGPWSKLLTVEKCRQRNPVDKSVVSKLKKMTVIIDNASRELRKAYPYVKFCHTRFWLMEAMQHFVPKNVKGAHLYLDMDLSNYEDFISTNNLSFHNKPKNFQFLVGNPGKIHRADLVYRLYKSGAAEKGSISSLDRTTNLHNIIYAQYNFIDYDTVLPEYLSAAEGDTEKTAKESFSPDRFINPDWLKNYKVWVAAESVFTMDERVSNQMQFEEEMPPTIDCLQLTEKTFKPLAYGMPFLVSGAQGTLSMIEDLGFNSYIDVFGNYEGSDFRETNQNISEIVNCLDGYNEQMIADIAVSNYEHMLDYNQSLRSDCLNMLISILE